MDRHRVIDAYGERRDAVRAKAARADGLGGRVLAAQDVRADRGAFRVQAEHLDGGPVGAPLGRARRGIRGGHDETRAELALTKPAVELGARGADGTPREERPDHAHGEAIASL